MRYKIYHLYWICWIFWKSISIKYILSVSFNSSWFHLAWCYLLLLVLSLILLGYG